MAVTWLASDDGIDGSESGARCCPPRYLYMPSVVPKAWLTSAAVPRASIQCRFSGVPVTFSPCDSSHDDTESTSACLGEKRARKSAGVRYCP
jgi:hypothetical protein